MAGKKGVNKGRKSTKAEREAGAKNLQKWKRENPEAADRAALTHGAYSAHIRERYTDKRTTEGKRLASVVDALTEDLGGPGELTAAQQVVLGFLTSKLIVIWQLSDYADRQTSILDDKGNVLPCFSKVYLSYLESAAKDLERLFGLQRGKQKKKIPTIDDLIRRGEGSS